MWKSRTNWILNCYYDANMCNYSLENNIEIKAQTCCGLLWYQSSVTACMRKMHGKVWNYISLLLSNKTVMQRYDSVNSLFCDLVKPMKYRDGMVIIILKLYQYNQNDNLMCFLSPIWLKHLLPTRKSQIYLYRDLKIFCSLLK